jgi:hypothetical protein
VPHYRLEWHVNVVTRNGLDRARPAAADRGKPIGINVLVTMLIPHDVDTPLIDVRESDPPQVAGRISARCRRRHVAQGAWIRPRHHQHRRAERRELTVRSPQ